MRRDVVFPILFATLLGCDKPKDSESPDEGASKGESKTLCTRYHSCNDCIAGLQRDEAYEKGRAETACGAAVTGCWTTWDKPVKCGDEK